jgi:hypothetical protein
VSQPLRTVLEWVEGFLRTRALAQGDERLDFIRPAANLAGILVSGCPPPRCEAVELLAGGGEPSECELENAQRVPQTELGKPEVRPRKRSPSGSSSPSGPSRRTSSRSS